MLLTGVTVVRSLFPGEELGGGTPVKAPLCLKQNVTCKIYKETISFRVKFCIFVF